MIEYHIVEIFESLQGEGYNTGMPAIFIRFGGCDLRCKWCDTNFNQYQKMTLNEILERIKNYSSKNIIITGGEPTLQKKMPELLEQLKAYGYFIAIESNGLHPFSTLIDYIAISPKFAYQDKYQTIQNKADEVRIVVESDKDFYDFCMEMENKIVAKRYYLSPCEISGKYNFLETIQLLGKINQNRRSNKWMLNIQTHKLCNIE